MSLYKGFSTVGRQHKFKLTDFDLAKQDLINHLQIRKGEKLMNPDFGCGVWALLFENMSGEWRDEVISEIGKVIDYEPRMTLIDIVIVEFDKGIQVELDLLYTGAVTPVKLLLAFETETQTVTEI